MLLALAASCSASALPDESTKSTVDYLGAMHSFVTAWIKAAADVPANVQAKGPQVWSGWEEEVGPLRMLLPIPEPASHHPWAGCKPSPICYPSPNFLTDLIHAQMARWSSITGAVNELPPGCILAEFGSYLGESSVGWADALKSLNLRNQMAIVAIDTWHEHEAHTGPMLRETKFYPPQVALQATRFHPEWLLPGRTLLFEQYVRNVNSSGKAARDLVRPVPLLSPDAEARGAALGATGVRPFLIYINPPARAERMQHDLLQAWRLLACGGTLAGAGYHLFQHEIQAFAARISGQPKLVTHIVHAPGAAKFENRSVPYSDEGMIENHKTNFSTWTFEGKVCSS